VEHLGATYIQFDAPSDQPIGGLSVHFNGEDVGAWEERLVKVSKMQEVEVDTLHGGRGKVMDWGYYGDLILLGVVTKSSKIFFPYTYTGEQSTSPWEPPSVASLDAPYPNPFSVRKGEKHRMIIPFGLTRAAEVVISIHTVDGALVRRLPLGRLEPWYYGDLAWWNGCNEGEVLVGNGMYVVQLDAGGLQARRMVAVVRED
jgi:hypothetical protein